MTNSYSDRLVPAQIYRVLLECNPAPRPVAGGVFTLIVKLVPSPCPQGARRA